MRTQLFSTAQNKHTLQLRQKERVGLREIKGKGKKKERKGKREREKEREKEKGERKERKG